MAILPQYDGESDPKQFVLKYGVVIEATRGGGGGPPLAKLKPSSWP